MKLIGAGLPRTATLTQKTALEMLGVGPCYHMVNVLADLDQVELWMAALEGEAQWEKIFAGFNSTVDWPGGYFYRELMEVYPDAMVLLSVRDPQAWAKSARDTVWSVRHGESLMRLLSSSWGQVDPKWGRFLEMVDAQLWKGNGTFAVGGHADLQQLADGMTAFNEEVKRTVPAERLLVWEPRDGWEPLCEALGLPVPAEPLPHVNDSEEFVERVIDGALGGLQAWQESRTPASS